MKIIFTLISAIFLTATTSLAQSTLNCTDPTSRYSLKSFNVNTNTASFIDSFNRINTELNCTIDLTKRIQIECSDSSVNVQIHRQDNTQQPQLGVLEILNKNEPLACRGSLNSVATEPTPDDCGKCYGMPRPDQFCRVTCHCSSVFCGAW
jgi:hypothetical protein